MTENPLKNDIKLYSEWRARLSQTISDLSDFLSANKVTDLHTHQQFDVVLGSLADDNLSVAFVAEFSRGKSEMINSIFFGNYERRILPSGTGRTTMCPTELMYDADTESSIRLLPIESRNEQKPLFELKREPHLWHEIKFDAEDVDSISRATRAMTESKLVSKEYANGLDFDLKDGDDSTHGLPLNEYDEVEIPCWRHAIINLPHPLLEQGLVILDTPGLNAIGAEPELTINQLATAHTVVFVLSHDTGVTASDLTLWRQHLGSPQDSRKLVVLNKIDSLWDGIRSDIEIEHEIAQQVDSVADTLQIDSGNIFPVSAQKGFLGKLSKDTELTERSRIATLEKAIADQLIPEKQKIVVEKVSSSLENIMQTSRAILENRLDDVNKHRKELNQLADKNSDVITHIMSKVQAEKSALEKDMQRYEAMRSVYSKETHKLIRLLSAERLEKLIAVTRHNMARCASSITLQRTITRYFSRLNQYIDEAITQASEIGNLSTKITEEFEQEHGIANISTPRLRLEKYKHELATLEQKNANLSTAKSLFLREQMSITNRFYESVCANSRIIFERALKESKNWNNNLMVPVETYIREHHSLLRRRLESVKRIHKASDTVDDRLEEMGKIHSEVYTQKEAFTKLEVDLNNLLELQIELPQQEHQEGSAQILYLDQNLTI